MGLFFKSKDINLFNTINRELINNIIDTTINVFKMSAYDNNTNLYGEALKKIYFPGVTVAGLIAHENESFEDDEGYGPNATQTISVNFHRDTLEDINLYPEIGDIIEYNNKHFEIGSVIENQFIGGNTDLNFSIICECNLTRKSRVGIDRIKRAAAENIDSLYK